MRARAHTHIHTTLFLIHSDPHLSQVRLGEFDLAHEFLVRLGAVVEGEDAPAEAAEKVRAEGDEGPEW